MKKTKKIEPKPPSKPKPQSFTVSDAEQKANEQQAAYPNTGPFGIGMIKGK